MNWIEPLQPFVSWLLQTSWQASLLALFVLLLQRIFRNRLDARWIYALWGLVLIRLLAPSLPESPSSVYHLTTVPASPSVWMIATVAPALPDVFDAPLAQAPAPPISFLQIFSACWFVGALVVASISVILHLRLARRLNAARLVQDPQIKVLLKSCAEELRLTRVPRTIIFPGISSPAVIGLWHPSLLLPENLSSRFSTSELRFIFLHELAHLKRGDLLVQWLLTFLQIFHWFNPVLWFAFTRLRQDREAATDAMVLAQTGETSRRDYGNTLLKLLEQFEHRNSLAGIVGILENKGPVRQRILHISRFTRSSYRWSLPAVILLGGVSLFFLTSPRKKTPSPSAATILSGKQNSQAAFNEKISQLRIGPVQANNLPLSEFNTALEKQFRKKDPDHIPFAINIHYLPNASPLNITIDLTNPTMMEVFNKLVEKYDIHDAAGTGEHTLYVRSAEDIAFRKKAAATFVTVKLDSLSLKDSLLAIQKEAEKQGFSFGFKRIQTLSNDSKITLDLKNYPLEKALHAVGYLGNFGLDCGDGLFYTVVPAKDSTLVRIESKFMKIPRNQMRPERLEKMKKDFLISGFTALENTPGIAFTSAPTVVVLNKSTCSVEVGEQCMNLTPLASGKDLSAWVRLKRKTKGASVEDFEEYAQANWKQQDGQSFLIVPSSEKTGNNPAFQTLICVTLTVLDIRTGQPLLSSLPSYGLANLEPISSKPVHGEKPQVEIKAHLMEVFVSNLSVAETQAFHSALAKDDVNFLMAMQQVNSITCPVIAIDENQVSRVIEVVRDFRFPISAEKTPGFPMTPTKFETIPVGVRIEVNAKSQSEGTLLSGKLQLREFEGLTQGEDNMGAAFNTQETRFNSLVQNGIPRVVNHFSSTGKQSIEENGQKRAVLVEKETFLILTATKLAL